MAQSVSAWTVKEILGRDTFTELIQCFRSFSESYIRSRTEVDVNFILFSKDIVLRTIKTNDLTDKYLSKLSLYKRLAEYKIRLVEELLWPQLLSIEQGLRRMTEDDAATTGRRNLILRNSLLCSSISPIFFSIEHCCKIACSLGKVEFAQRVATDQIIQHQYVYDTLRDLSEKKYLLDFDSLKKLYAYAIKTRMVADYTDFFLEQYDAAPFLFYMLLPAANDILNSQNQLLFECVGI